MPEEVLAAIDGHAKRLGLSRSEYLRRALARDAAVSGSSVTSADLESFGETFADLADSEVMRGAWE